MDPIEAFLVRLFGQEPPPAPVQPTRAELEARAARVANAQRLRQEQQTAAKAQEDARVRRLADPFGQLTDEQYAALLQRFPLTNVTSMGTGQARPLFQVQQDGSIKVEYANPLSQGAATQYATLPNVATAVQPNAPVAMSGTPMAGAPAAGAAAAGAPGSYAELTNPYGNAYMQRLQEQLAGRSEANLQRMNALMSQRGMGGTGLASARALQAQSDVGQQLLGAQQEATQLGAQFDLSRLAGLTGQQQFARQQSEAERQAAASRALARRADVRAERGQVAELLAPAAKAAALGMSRPAASTTGGGIARPPQQQMIGFTNPAGQYSQMTPQAFQRQQEQAFKKLFNPLRGTSLEGM